MPLARVRLLYKTHGHWVPLAAFLLGFLFDIIMLTRIDAIEVILQQAVQLVIVAVLVAVALIEETREVHSPRFLNKVWRYREAFLHFLFGALLNGYVIFYFKSSSAFTTLFFIGPLVVLLTLNEFKRFGTSQAKIHVAVLSLCLISFFVSLAPTLMGFIGTLPFLCAVAMSAAIFSGYYVLIKKRMAPNLRRIKHHLLYPFVIVQALFVILYFANAIPPVPLSVKYMGIYHGVEKTEAGYELTYTRPKWKFWQHGDQTFLARPGDVIHCYAQVFSPTRFKDQLQVRWLYWDEQKGWLPSDSIPMPVLGGREEGFRAVMKKSNFQPGQWRVQVETMNNQEIGRIGFTVVADESVDQRTLHKVIR